MASVPRTLTELLSGFIDDIGDQITDAYKNLETFIKKDRWTKEFQDYLQKRELEDEENMLKFVLLTEIVLKYEKLINDSESLKKKNANNRNKERLKHEQRQVFDFIMITFFSEDSENQIALSNQKLFDILSSYAENTGSDQPVNGEMLEHLKKAEKDSKVWLNGLDPAYMNFLKQTNTSKSAIACLLSIL